MRFGFKILKGSILALCLAVALLSHGPVKASDPSELVDSFRQFLAAYITRIKSGDRDFLRKIHPGLPEEQRGFFIGITLDMMKYADDEGLSPGITCREYDVCKATWPQPGGSWAAQQFIRYEGQWRWLQY